MTGTKYDVKTTVHRSWSNRIVRLALIILCRFLSFLSSCRLLGAVGVSFGTLFDDEEGQQFFEAIVGTLRAAKKRGVVDFKGQVCVCLSVCAARKD